MQVYLDNSATTRQYDRVTDIMCKYMREEYGNPSSLHTLGVSAEKIVKEGRKAIAVALGAGDDEIFFTSCGTESDNTVLLQTAEARHRSGKKIITTAVEHPAILEPAAKLEALGYDVEYIGVDSKCRLDIKALKEAVTEDTLLISVMGVNNETGTIMPLKEIGDFKAEYNKLHGTDILFHTDGVQAFGKIPMNMKSNLKNVDFLSASAHKIHGPKGMGALYIRKGINIKPFLLGGGQEKHMRSGTENTPGIAGFGLAASMSVADFDNKLKKMSEVRNFLLSGIKSELEDVLINSPEDESGCPSVLNVSFLGCRGEVLLHTLEQDGIYVSTGSACASNKKGMSHVLKAMGLNDRQIEGAIRFSFSEFNTTTEMEYVLDKLKNAVTRFRKLGSFR